MKVNLLGILFVVLVVLKVTGFTSISWVWVCAPIWMPTVGVIAVIMAVLLGTGLLDALEQLTRTIRKK